MRRTVICAIGFVLLAMGWLPALSPAGGVQPPAAPELPELPPLPPLPTQPPLVEADVAEPEVRIDVGEGVLMDFVFIRAGDFMMGSKMTSLGRRGDESPRHKVTITQPFYIGKTEVTQIQYEPIMGDNPSEEQGGRFPVHSVTWYEAVEFCKRLTAREREAGRLKDDEEYRLPTEAEWEHACHAGTDSRFSFGSVDTDLMKHGWCMENSEERPHVVRLLRPSPWGTYDMHGNVWEWCQDWYAPLYRRGSAKDPTGPRRGTARVARGGSWMNPMSSCRSASRFSAQPKARYSFVGFRVIRTIALTTPEEED